MAGRGRGRGVTLPKVADEAGERRPGSAIHERVPEEAPPPGPDSSAFGVVGRGRGRGHLIASVHAEIKAETGGAPMVQPHGSSLTGSSVAPAHRFSPPQVSPPGVPAQVPVPEFMNHPSIGRGQIFRGGRGERSAPGIRDLPSSSEEREPGSSQPQREPERYEEGQFDDATTVTEVGALSTRLSGVRIQEAVAAPSSVRLQEVKKAGSDINQASEDFFEGGRGKPRGASSVSSLATERTGFRAELETVEEVAVEVPTQEETKEDPVIRRGTKGSPILLGTNFFKLRISEGKGRFQYKVQFDPVIDGVSVRKGALRQIEAIVGPASSRQFDGSHLFLPIKLEQDLSQFEVNYPGTSTDPEAKIIIQLEFLRQCDLEECLYLYNVLLRKAIEAIPYVEMRDSHYDPGRMTVMREQKLEIWPGVNTSVQNFEGGLQLCVAGVSRILRQTTLYDYLEEVRRGSGQDYKEKFMEYTIGKIVLTRYNNRTYRIDDVDWDHTPEHTFEKKGTRVTFSDYFSQQHGAIIHDKRQPLVVSRIKARKNDQSAESKLVLLVPELCYVTGFSDEIRSNQPLMRTIMGNTALSPPKRMEDMMQFIKTLKGNKEAGEILKIWGIEICGKITSIQGRLMKGPTLYFTEGFSLPAASSDFSRDAVSNTCHTPIPLKNWIIFCQQNDKDKATSALQNYRSVIRALGIRMTTDPEIVVVRSSGRFPGPSDFKKALRERANPKEIQFVMVILPQARDDLYSAVKTQCLVDMAIPSQCVLSKTLTNERRLRSVMQKIALQINCKLGGALWALNIPLQERIMFVGVDTHHDPKRKARSVMAMVATLNSACTQYYSRVSFQSPHQESADALKSLFAQGLAAFFEENSDWPDRIVVFRDGISDGQLGIIKLHEVEQLKTTIASMTGRNVKFAYIVVQKRINERIFLMDRGHVDNPPPGTVVDHNITRRNLYDFFLVSQLVRQGTVTPSHYIVLEDSGENSPDLMQKFAFVLSFMYFNWPGAIRGPAMCQYAHKLAMLVGQHLRGEPLAEMEKKLFYL